MTAARVLRPTYHAVLLVRPEAWPAFFRWLPTSGLASTAVRSPDTVPRFDLALGPGRAHRDLSPREIDVVELMAAGYQNPEIATRLSISVETVRVHSKHIYRKLEARSRAHAVHIAHQRGILGGS